jgi:L-fuconolactonase
MIGSDWPVCTVAASYADVIDLVRETTSEYSLDERERIFSGTARDFFRLKAEATSKEDAEAT